MTKKDWIPASFLPNKKFVPGVRMPASSMSEYVLTVDTDGLLAVGFYSFSSNQWHRETDDEPGEQSPVAYYMYVELPDEFKTK